MHLWAIFFRENVTLILPCLTSIILQVRIYSHWYYKHNQEDNCNISRKIANYCNWCTPFLTSRWHNHCHRNIWNHLIFPSLGCYFVVSTCKSCKKGHFLEKNVTQFIFLKEIEFLKIFKKATLPTLREKLGEFTKISPC